MTQDKEMNVSSEANKGLKVFVFSPENQKEVALILKKYPENHQASAVVPLLDLAQRQCGGWLPQAAIEAVAHLLKMPAIRAYEIATFYSMFNLSPVGKYHIQTCRTISCWLRGSSELQSVCETHLRIKPGEVTPDTKFSLVEVECLGACVNAPVVQINDDYYENLTPVALKEILQNLAIGKTPLREEKSSSLKTLENQVEGE